MKQQLDRLKALFHEAFSGGYGFSLRLRLFFFLILFLSAIMLTLLLILFSTGVFSIGLTESRIFLDNELNHVVENAKNSFGTLSVEGVALSQKISSQIEAELNNNGVSAAELKQHPKLLEEVLRSCLDPLLATLEKNAASAVFVILDATVNPSLPGAEGSRAGLFLRNMEPNAVNRTNPSIHYMRGPIALARERGIRVLPQWDMEFSVQPDDFFHTTLKGAHQGLDLSRMYYWNPKSVLHGDYEEAMLLCVPMLASDGSVLGVCGFEVNSMLFKLQSAPYASTHSRVFSLLAPMEGDALDVSKAMLAGFYDETQSASNSTLTAVSHNSGMTTFATPGGLRFCGLHREISLYPKDAVHGERWAIAVMMPESDLNVHAMRRNIPILLLLATLLTMSVLAASLISNRYLAPVLQSIDMVKTQNPSAYTKTNIKEIDDLFAFLAEKDAANNERSKSESLGVDAPRPKPDPDAEAMFLEFSKKYETLSRAEKAVFNLYAQGYDAQEITQILCLSINTIKTHNKRIYWKLGVNSRKELMGYLRKMREQGFDLQVDA
ncbi:MAG: response regulator transcription factor [Christensenellales bacterium]|jgi:DNA-binding CsgD family transcriptional regulator